MKDKNVAAILAFFFGWSGAHKFYLGQIGWGIVYLAFCWTLIPSLVAFIEFVILAVMDKDEFNRRFNGANTLPAGGPVVVNVLPPSPYYPPPGYGYGPPQPYGSYPPPGYPGHAGHAGYPGHPGGPQALPSAAGPPALPGAGQTSQVDVVAKLEKLNELRIAGLLTDDEFNRQKARILEML